MRILITGICGFVGSTVAKALLASSSRYELFGLDNFIRPGSEGNRADQGIFAYWINSWLRKRPLKYLGFGGHGHQVRDCLHPRDLAPLLQKQMGASALPTLDRICNVSGGADSARSLRQLSDWCARRFGPHSVVQDGTPRPFDIPWIVLDSTKATRLWGWTAATPTDAVLEEIAVHAEAHPHWLELSAPL